MDAPPGRGLYLFLQRGRDRTELDVPWGTVQSEPLARLQAHVGIFSPTPPSYSAPMASLTAQEISATVSFRLGALLIILRAKLASEWVSWGRVRTCCCCTTAGRERFQCDTFLLRQKRLHKTLSYHKQIKKIWVVFETTPPQSSDRPNITQINSYQNSNHAWHGSPECS